MKTKNILIASILKPANDTRMLNKMAVSLAGINDFRIHIFGCECGLKAEELIEANNMNVEFHCHAKPSRNIISRIKACWKFYIIAIKLKPELTITNSFDIQLIMLYLNILYKLKYLYDVRENYYLNIKYQSTYPFVLRHVLSVFVRLLEYIGFMNASGSIVAETCYTKQIKFLANKPILIALNKTSIPIARNTISTAKTGPTPTDIRCLFSGYLSKESGIFTAINWCIEWQKKYACLTLHIIGYAIKKADQEIIFLLAKKYNWIKLTGINQLVPHDQICLAIENANIGILAYRISKANTHKTPTKYFEYSASQMYIVCDADNYKYLDLLNKTNIYLANSFDKMLNAKNISIGKNNLLNTNFWDCARFSNYVFRFC